MPAPELIASAQAGDKRATDQLVRASMWIVKAQVRKWPKGDPDDLTQIALIGESKTGAQWGGLLGAIRTFEPEGGQSFWTHATRGVAMALSNANLRAKREKKRRGGRCISIESEITERRSAQDLDQPASGRGSNRQIAQLASHHNPEAEASARERLRRVVTLPPRVRTAVEGRAVGEVCDDLAEEMGVSRQTVQALSYEGRDALRRGR